MRNAREKARKMLAGAETSVDELKDVALELKRELEFGLARKLLAKAMALDPTDLKIKQQFALCTYKDEELAPGVRHATALNVLEGIGLRDSANTNSETLALGGAVYKRIWEHGGQLEHLFDSLSFYRAAYERNPDTDIGYGGVNAAYIQQLLASRARAASIRTGTVAVEAEKLDGDAEDLRKKMAEQLSLRAQKDPGLMDQYWFVVTLAEVYFGLRDYEKAGKWLYRAREMDVPEWERQTTFRQFVSIARLQGATLPEEDSEQSSWHPAWRALEKLLGAGTEVALSCFRGKVGLALSGGGFRASLFHLGVLARLAEMDVLRSVEVLSTVSGGSIVGAHYYLEVRKLLQAKPDSEITREDYIDIVRQLHRDFLEGVQQNLRTRALASFLNNVRLIFSKSYSRTHRIGELYEKELYAKVQDGHPKDQPRSMRDLLIHPHGGGVGFKPRFSNWRRRAKVPALLLNTTSLNSGHNWHFTARWMGEPPGLLGSEVDKNARYRRLYYEQAPTEKLRDFPLGYAVAASACVPGLFEPLAVEGLFPDRVVRLVDGGVHDNQGVAGLLDEGCTYVLCSDASGQMKDENEPSDGLLAVPLRSNSIMMDRVREAEYQDLRAREDSRSLQGLFFIHLKKDLPVPPVDWVNCQDASQKPHDEPTFTPYGVDRDIQKKIALIRTDLDSFSEVEASALMSSGYLMAESESRELQNAHVKNGEVGTWGGYDVNAGRQDWPFLRLEPILKLPESSTDPRRKDLGSQLDVASSLLFKVWKRSPNLRFVKWGGAAAGLLLLGSLVMTYWDWTLVDTTISVGGLILFLSLAAGGLIFPWLRWVSSPEKLARGYLLKIAIAFFGSFAAKLHIHVFDKIFLRLGKLDRLLDQKER